MAPQKKAEELVKNFYDVMYESMNIDWKEEAKQCALICCDEIINTYGYSNYWEVVKECIKEL